MSAVDAGFFGNMMRCEVRLEYASEFTLMRKWPLRQILFWKLLDLYQGHRLRLILHMLFWGLLCFIWLYLDTPEGKVCVPSSGIELSLWETHCQVFISFFNNTESFLGVAVWCRPTLRLALWVTPVMCLKTVFVCICVCVEGVVTDAITLRTLAPFIAQRKCFSVLNELTCRSKRESQLKQLPFARLVQGAKSEKSHPLQYAES